jgi:hypothetical protein
VLKFHTAAREAMNAHYRLPALSSRLAMYQVVSDAQTGAGAIEPASKLDRMSRRR